MKTAGVERYLCFFSQIPATINGTMVVIPASPARTYIEPNDSVIRVSHKCAVGPEDCRILLWFLVLMCE